MMKITCAAQQRQKANDEIEECTIFFRYSENQTVITYVEYVLFSKKICSKVDFVCLNICLQFLFFQITPAGYTLQS